MIELGNVLDESTYNKIKARWDAIAKPIDGMGKFEELVARIGAIQHNEEVDISKRCVLIFCADNGIVEEGVSQTGQDVTFSVAEWMGKKESSVCRLAVPQGVEIIPVDIGINSEVTPEGVLNRKISKGTRNFLKSPAMTEEECRRAIETGTELVRMCKEKGFRIIASGEMGIGNTTTSAALAELFLGLGNSENTRNAAEPFLGSESSDSTQEVSDGDLKKTDSAHLNTADVNSENRGIPKPELLWRTGEENTADVNSENGMSEGRAEAFCSETVRYVGRGSGLDDKGFEKKKQVISKAVELYRGKDPFEILRSAGGLDIAALAGAFIGGAKYNVPVIIDGVISAVAAVAAEKICPGAKDCMIPSHIGKEAATEAALDFLGLKELAVLRADMALGEGTGAVMLFPLLDLSVSMYNNAYRFEETKVEKYERFS